MLKKVIVVIFFLSIAILYIHNLTRDVYSGDIGDLVTASYIGGVPHAPGYPLFTLLGFIMSKLPISLPVVSRVGLISVFSSIIALIFYYKFAMRVTTKSVFLSLLSTSVLAFSYLFWLSVEVPEVFALNNVFAVVILYLGIQFYEKKSSKHLYWLAFVSGLSLTHHFSIVLIFPSIIILILRQAKFVFRKRSFFLSLLLFLVGLTIYLYIPLSAAKNPVINWDSASNLKNFIHLVSRKDYGVAPGIVNNIPWEVKLIHVRNYFKSIISVFSYQILFVALIGLLFLIKKDKWLFITLLLAYLLSGALSIFYAASTITTSTAWGIIERFYTLSTVIFMFFIPYGFVFLKSALDKKFSKPIYSVILLSYFLIIPVMMVKYNFPRTDLSKTSIGNSLARNIFSTLPKNAVLFVSGDTTAFNIWYLYYVLGERQDIDIINPQGVGNNLYLDGEINAYYKKNPKTKIGEVFPQTFAEIRKKRPTFATFKINSIPKGAVLIPKGLVYEIADVDKVKSKEQYLTEVEAIWKRMRVQRRETLAPAEQNFITPEIPLIYSNGLIHTGDFIDAHYDDPAKAEHYYRRALWIDYNNPEAYSGLARSLYKAYKDCKNTIANINYAVEIYPVWRFYYIQQYFFYKQCGAESKKLKSLKEKFAQMFKQDIDLQIKSP